MFSGPILLKTRDNRPMVEIIHDIALSMGAGSGEPSSEMAGQLVSVVVASPEAGEALRTYGLDAIIYDLVPFVGGRLTHRTSAGLIVSGELAAAHRAGVKPADAGNSTQT